MVCEKKNNAMHFCLCIHSQTANILECRLISVQEELEEHVLGSAIVCTLLWPIRMTYWMLQSQKYRDLPLQEVSCIWNHWTYQTSIFSNLTSLTHLLVRSFSLLPVFYSAVRCLGIFLNSEDLSRLCCSWSSGRCLKAVIPYWCHRWRGFNHKSWTNYGW